MTGRSHRSWGYFGILRALTGLGHLKWPPPTPVACSSACLPALSHAVGGLAPSPAPGLLLGPDWIWADLSAQEDIRTLQVLLGTAGTTGLCSRGRSSQQEDGPVGDDPIVVVCQSPPLPPVSGALLSTKPMEG